MIASEEEKTRTFTPALSVEAKMHQSMPTAVIFNRARKGLHELTSRA